MTIDTLTNIGNYHPVAEFDGKRYWSVVRAPNGDWISGEVITEDEAARMRKKVADVLRLDQAPPATADSFPHAAATT